MNKETLRTSYIDKGWEVQPVADWRLVSAVEGKVKYDVNVASPEDKFGTVQVVVLEDGKVGESSTAGGFWKDAVSDFGSDLRAFLTGKEKGSVYAISVSSTKEQDEVAEVKVYTTVTGGVEVSTYVVKRRADVFDFKQII